jgi:uncharacterized membrane protein YeiB
MLKTLRNHEIKKRIFRSWSQVIQKTLSLSIPSPGKRIVGYDLARAVALLGMLLVNFSVLFGVNESDPAWLTYLVEIIKGRAAATFVVLAGVGLSLLTKSVYLNKDRAALNAKRLTLLKRSLFLLVIGLFNFVISPISDILHFYAVYIALGACFLTFSSLSLWLLTACAITCRPLVFVAFGFVKNWDLNNVSLAGFWDLPGIIGHIFFNGCFPVIPWMAFITLGMWIGRQDFSDRAFRKKILLTGIGAVAVAELLSGVGIYLSATAELGRGVEKLLLLFQIVSWDPIPLFMISAMGTALVVISLIMILADRYGNSRWIMPFVSVGQITLTLYIIHILVGCFLLQMVEELEREIFLLPLWGTVLFFIVALVLSHYWLKRFQKGPLEWLMRRCPLHNNKPLYTQKIPVLPG